MGINNMYWIKDKPTKKGKYWCLKNGLSRVVSVWKYDDDNDNRLFTNEDGGGSLADSFYNNCLWSNIPIPEPASIK